MTEHYSQLKYIDTAYILAGGRGTRLSEQTKMIPKPLVKVNGKPIIYHIMCRLARQGIKNFYILSGYLSDEIWSWLVSEMDTDVFFPKFFNKEHLCVKLKDEALSNTIIHLVYTGENSGTAERLYSMKLNVINENKPFLMTYGDTYSNVDISKIEEELFKSENRVLSLCGVPYKERFGLIKIDDNKTVLEFKEKSESKDQFINGGFICMKPEIYNYILPNHFDFSKDTMESKELVGKIGAYIHTGYWKAVDTQRDLDEINQDFINNKQGE